MTRLTTIRRRAEAATPGTWVNDHLTGLILALSVEPGLNRCICYPHRMDHLAYEENADFIAHAREDVPYLLGLVEELRGALEIARHAFGLRNEYQGDAIEAVDKALSSLEEKA